VPSDAGSERLCVAVLVTDPEDRVLLVQSGKGGDRGWEFPGGNVDPGEDPRDAARREVIEETGLEVALTSAGPLTLPKSARRLRGAVLFYGRAEGEPRPGSDAVAVGWFTAGEVEQLNRKGVLSDLANREVLLNWAREKRVPVPPAEPPPAAGFAVRFASAEDAGLLLGMLVGLKLFNANVLGALGDRTEAIIEALGGDVS
jgi:8-oxo-dGTP pyrophosphatase MutT (NUDIX family)